MPGRWICKITLRTSTRHVNYTLELPMFYGSSSSLAFNDPEIGRVLLDTIDSMSITKTVPPILMVKLDVERCSHLCSLYKIELIGPTGPGGFSVNLQHALQLTGRDLVFPEIVDAQKTGFRQIGVDSTKTFPRWDPVEYQKYLC